MNRKNGKLKLGKLKCISVFYFLFSVFAFGQTHTMPGSNVVPSGASLTINSGGSITAAAGSTVTGFGSGGGGAPTTATYITQTTDAGLSAEVALSSLATGLLKSTITTGALTTITDNSTNWNTAFTQTRQWDGGSTGLTAATGRTSLGATTVGSNIFTLTNPSAISWLEISALNAVTAVSAATMRTDLSLVPGTNVEVPLTFSTGLTRSTNTVTVNTSQNIATLSNLTTNGFVKTGGAVGTLSVDTATYQPADTDLTTWAGITPVAAVGTWIATPSSANLRLAMTDENGTGALLFSGATTPDFTTGFTIGAAAASGKILVGNGTNFVPSTPTYPNAASPTARKFIVSDGTNWVASTETQAVPGINGNVLTSDGTNWISNGLPRMTLTSTVDQTATTIQAHMTYTVPANTAQIGTVYRIHAFGNIDNNTTAITYTFNTLWGGTGGVTLNTIAVTGSTTLNTNRQWVYDGTLTIRTTGASGTGVSEGSLTERTTSATGVEAAHVNNAGTTALVLDTTINKDLVLTWAMNVTTGTPHVRTIGGYVELVR